MYACINYWGASDSVNGSAVRIFEILNRIVTSVFDSIRNEHNYWKSSNTYRHQFLTYLTEWRRLFTLATTPSNQQNQQTWSRLHRQCRCHLKTIKTLCSAIKQSNLFNKYLLLVTLETDDNYSIRFEISNNSSTIQFDSIRNEKTLFA